MVRGLGRLSTLRSRFSQPSHLLAPLLAIPYPLTPLLPVLPLFSASLNPSSTSTRLLPRPSPPSPRTHTFRLLSGRYSVTSHGNGIAVLGTLAAVALHALCSHAPCFVLLSR